MVRAKNNGNKQTKRCVGNKQKENIAGCDARKKYRKRGKRTSGKQVGKESEERMWGRSVEKAVQNKVKGPRRSRAPFFPGVQTDPVEDS